ncbi:MAG: cadherin-like domain-containing protein, partial [Proteobacteria bacterium]|nr:cadherin-like domain-containing protein [Pseudomonadota bacterium]
VDYFVLAWRNVPLQLNPMINDFDVDGDNITLVSVDTTGILGSIVEFSENGDMIYSPPLNYNGLDSFTYTITDGFEQSTATVTIDVVD